MKTIEIEKDRIILEFSLVELCALCGALNEVSNSIEVWEFGIRMGIEINEAINFLDKLNLIYEELSSLS